MEPYWLFATYFYKVFDDPHGNRLVMSQDSNYPGHFQQTELSPPVKCYVEVTNPKTNEKFDLVIYAPEKGLELKRLSLMTVNKGPIANILSIL